MSLCMHVTRVLFLVLPGNFALNMGFYWSYTSHPFLCALAFSKSTQVLLNEILVHSQTKRSNTLFTGIQLFTIVLPFFFLFFIWRVGFPIFEASWSVDTRPGAQGGADCHLGHHHSSPCALLAVRVHLSYWISYSCVTDCCQKE